MDDEQKMKGLHEWAAQITADMILRSHSAGMTPADVTAVAMLVFIDVSAFALVMGKKKPTTKEVARMVHDAVIEGMPDRVDFMRRAFGEER